jgi:hypothetical protein
MLTLFADVTPASAVSLGVSAAAVVSIPALLFADATRADFDPRPALRRAVESGRFDPALIAVTNARHTARETAVRVRRTPLHAAISAAALLSLLFPASPEATR